MNYLNQLNPPQKEAVLHQEGPLLVIAGAGAGKTRTIAYRILHLIESGVKPESILAITFTNKAAREMRERVVKLLKLGGETSRSPEVSPPSSAIPMLTTFHSFGVYVLRHNGQRLGLSSHFSIFDRDESIAKIKEAIRAMGLDEKRFEPRKVLSAISRQKGDNISQREFQSKQNNNPYGKIIGQVWERYDNLLKANKALDFDDLLLKTVELFKTHHDILAIYQDRFRYIHVDEYQDTNVVQYELTNLLAEKHKNICVVGDMDQSIYGWRGADFTNLLHFEKDYAEAKIILLEENYRSTQTILTAANQVIEKNKQRHEKKLFTKNKEGARIGLYTGIEEGDEARFVAQKAKELIGEGANPNEIAVLYRANFQSRVLEEACLQENIPYQVLGTRFFDRKEIKDVVAFIRASLNPEDWESLKRIINVPARGIGKTTLMKLANGQFEELPATMKQKISKFKEILSAIGEFAIQNKPSELIKFIIDKTGLEKSLEEDGEDGQERLENIKELVNVATKYDNLPPEEAIEAMMTEIALATDQDELDQPKSGIKLMTVHAAKGLEFDNVFITGLEQDLFPHAGMGNEKRDDEEERRLFYVAVTRARHKLYLSYAQTRQVFGQRRVNMPSEFIFDIDEDLIENESGLWTIV
ncbi:MAG TPA: UvrD-helicase domain-containing protein [Candidatus Paceibacterota bacterium]|nr:UvrD-helicase domain-containing protein [Candidatus Paceibacterota bacterium]